MPPPMNFEATFCAPVSPFETLYPCVYYFKQCKLCSGSPGLLTKLSDIFGRVTIPEKGSGDYSLGVVSVCSVISQRFHKTQVELKGERAGVGRSRSESVPGYLPSSWRPRTS